MKNDISQRQIVDEFENAGRFSVVGYNPKTGKRAGTYSGLSLHAAFGEVVRRNNAGQRVLVFTDNTRDNMSNSYDDALQSEHLVDLPGSFGRRTTHHWSYWPDHS